MATPAQLAANQANAQLSSGPRTPEGKAVSSQNSLRHGFASQTVLLAGESSAEYESLFFDLAASFPTMGIFALERAVREMANAEWRLRRARRHQEILLNDKIAELQTADPAADSLRLQLRAFEALAEDSKCFKLLMRYETKFENQYNRAHRDWHAHHKQLEAAAPAPAPENWVHSEKPKNAPSATPPVPRNAPCPCGSGEKYKRCCGKSAPPVLFPNS